MTRKVIIDVDPGIDAVVALSIALFDPRLDVVAVTAVAGSLSATQATRNVQAIIEQLDPPRWPRIGAAVEPESAPALAPLSQHYGVDGLGNAGFRVAELHHQHPSEKVITEEIRQTPEHVTVLALGPATNVALALRRDASLASQFGQIVFSGGTVRAPGNATPAAEFNMYFDPVAARDLFRSRTTKTLVPLDSTTQVVFGYDRLEQLPDETTRIGRLLRKLLPVAFRAHRQDWGMEGIWLHDAVTLVAMTDPEFFTMQRLAGDVETLGELTTGATVFDRRATPEWRNNIDVAIEADVQGVIDTIMRGLQRAADHC